MSTQAIGLSGILPNINLLGSLQGISGSTQSLSAGQVGDPGASGDSNSISQAGQLLSKLEKLKEQDPAKFKQLLAQIADQLSAAAQQPGQGNQAQLLNQLADRFKNAAQTGDLTQLQPGRGAHHHHHHRAQQAYGQNQPDPAQVLLDSVQSDGQHPALSADNQQLLSSIFQQLNSAVAGL